MSLIHQEIVDFKVQAFVKNEFQEITKKDVLGKWSVFFFYPILPLCVRQSLRIWRTNMKILRR